MGHNLDHDLNNLDIGLKSHRILPKGELTKKNVGYGEKKKRREENRG